jgi:SAM-dependent methyltransferase
MVPSPHYAACPVCGSRKTEPILALPRLPVLNTILWPSREEALQTVRGDILLTFCPSCGHVYNSVFDPRLIEYTPSYENSLHHSDVFQGYVEELARSLDRQYALKGKQVLEIGCGQGDFLALLCERADCHGIGFDPSYIEASATRTGRGRIEVVRDLYSARYSHYKADLIVCRQVLEHIPEPQKMLHEVRRSIGARSDTAVFFEVPNVLDHLRSRDLWALVYEHISYYSPASLAAGFSEAGFDVRGQRELFGPLFIGIDAVPASAPVCLPPDDQASRLREVTQLVHGFSEAAAKTLRVWEERFHTYASQNDRVVVWGGGARCTNFLNLVKGSSVVEYVVDINPRKHGTFVGGTGQRIVSPQFLVDYHPAIVVLLNPIYDQEVKASLAHLGVSATVVGVGAENS